MSISKAATLAEAGDWPMAHHVLVSAYMADEWGTLCAIADSEHVALFIKADSLPSQIHTYEMPSGEIAFVVEGAWNVRRNGEWIDVHDEVPI